MLGIHIIRHYREWANRSGACFMSFAAGALIYAGGSHLLPAAERENRRYTLIALATGVLVAVGIVLCK